MKRSRTPAAAGQNVALQILAQRLCSCGCRREQLYALWQPEWVDTDDIDAECSAMTTWVDRTIHFKPRRDGLRLLRAHPGSSGQATTCLMRLSVCSQPDDANGRCRFTFPRPALNMWDDTHVIQILAERRVLSARQVLVMWRPSWVHARDERESQALRRCLNPVTTYTPGIDTVKFPVIAGSHLDEEYGALRSRAIAAD